MLGQWDFTVLTYYPASMNNVYSIQDKSYVNPRFPSVSLQTPQYESEEKSFSTQTL